MSSYCFNSSINTDLISKDSFDLFVSMYNTVDQLYNSLFDSYGNSNLTEDELNIVLRDFLTAMRNELNTETNNE